MNRFHRRYCASRGWARHVERDLLPWALAGIELGDVVEIVQGDGTAMPFAAAGLFSAAACLTMLHHVPSADLQDALFADVHRVLRPGGIFAGSDSQSSPSGVRFRATKPPRV